MKDKRVRTCPGLDVSSAQIYSWEECPGGCWSTAWNKGYLQVICYLVCRTELYSTQWCMGQDTWWVENFKTGEVPEHSFRYFLPITNSPEIVSCVCFVFKCIEITIHFPDLHFGSSKRERRCIRLKESTLNLLFRTSQVPSKTHWHELIGEHEWSRNVGTQIWAVCPFKIRESCLNWGYQCVLLIAKWQMQSLETLIYSNIVIFLEKKHKAA